MARFFYGVSQSIVATVLVGILFWLLFLYFNTSGKVSLKLTPQGVEQVDVSTENHD